MPANLLDSPRHFTGAIILALGVAILIAVSPFAIGLLGVVVLHVLVAPLHARLAGPLGTRAAAMLVLLLVGLLVIVPGGFLLGLVIDQAPATIRSIQSNAVLTWLSTQRVYEMDVGAQLAKASGTILQWLSAQAFDIVGGAARGTLNFLIALFGLYYTLQSGADVWAGVKRFIPFSEANAEALRVRFVSVTQATFLGLAAVAVVQGALVGTGFAIVGLPGAAFWGVVTALASVIPLVGGTLVWVPGVLVLLVERDYTRAAILAGIGVVLVANIDNLVRPYIYRRVSNVHPLVTLVGAFAGLRYFGLLGVLLGPLAITYFFELLRIYDEEYGVAQSVREIAQKRSGLTPVAGVAAVKVPPAAPVAPRPAGPGEPPC
ncbi:MAG: AI-2E family transporter [Gemmatimonadetes bacterium]|nr:AI-2E family transporter [Gemmatimonadota bacterium]